MKEHEHEQTMEERRTEIEEGDAEKNVYSDAGRKELIEDDDSITDVDEGFMKGYDEGGKMAKCPVCNKILDDDFVEKEIDGEEHRFCCDEHAEKYAKQKGAPPVELEVGNMEKQIDGEEDLEDIEKDKKVLEETS